MNSTTHRPAHLRLLGALLCLVLAYIGFATVAKSADAAAPVIVNNGSVSDRAAQKAWLSSTITGGETGNSANKVRISLFVQHDPGRKVTGLRIDEDYNGTDNSATAALRPVTAEQPVTIGGYRYSRIDYEYTNSTSGLSSWSCSLFSQTFAQNRNIYLRVQLDNGEESASSVSDLRFFKANGCSNPITGSFQPYTYNQTQSATTVAPGGSVTFNYSMYNAATASLSTAPSGVRWRLRNSLTGAVTGTTESGYSATVTFPERGHWVVEGKPWGSPLLGGTTERGEWMYIGEVDVNSPASSSPTANLTATRPVVNGTTNINATGVADAEAANGGLVQDIMWDLDFNASNGVNGFEQEVLGDYNASPSSTNYSKTINTTGMTPGWYPVRMRLRDNGAYSGADDSAAAPIFSTQFLVDSFPVAVDDAVHLESDQTLPIAMSASDADVYPAQSINDNNTLTYTIIDAPDHGSLTAPSGNGVTYDPDDDFSGEDQFTFRVEDGWGGSDTATVKLKVDPATNIDAYPLTDQDSRGADIEFSSPTEGSTLVKFECSLDFAAWYDCDSPDELRNLSDGNHNMRTRAVGGDYEGTPTVDPTPSEVEWNVDATPHITFDSTPTPDSGDASPTFEFTAAEDGNTVPLTVECKLNDGPRQPCSSPVDLTDLEDGFHTFTVYAEDQYGRKSEATYNWEIRVGGVHTWISQKPSAFTSDQGAEFVLETTDPTNTFECRFNGGSWDPCTSPLDFTNLADGDYTLEVRAVNTAGVEDATPASWSWTVDTQAPSVALDEDPPAITNQPISLVFNSDEEVVEYRCAIDDGDFEPCSTPYTAPANLADGDHELQVVAVDRAGNTSTPVTAGWELDTVLPTSQIDSGPAEGALRNVDTASFEFSSSEPGTFQCRLDSQSWRSCDDPGAQDYAGIPDGDHTFRVRAVDQAGNVEATPQTRSWQTDTVRPVVNINDGPSGTVKETAASFDFDSSESGSTFECKVDGGSFASCLSPQAYSGLTDGKHEFAVRATDVAGNVSEYAAKRSWTIKTKTGNPTQPDPDAACNFHSASARCAQPVLSGQQKRLGKLKRRTTSPVATFNAGSTALESLRVSFGKGSVLRLTGKARNKPVARLVLKTKSGSSNVALKVGKKAKLGKKAKGAVALTKAGGVSATLARGSAPSLNITALPADVVSVKVTLKGRGMTVKTSKCGTQRWVGSAVDRDGYSGSATTWVDPPCPKPRKKGTR